MWPPTWTKKRKDQIKVRGTAKAVLLVGYPGCPNLVVCSIYDTKPVHYLSMICYTLELVVMEKPCFNVETGMIEILRYLRMNTIQEYNNTMGGVDLADQLWGTYCVDKEVHNIKWWWSILFWSICFMITNAYVIYLKINLDNGIKKRIIISPWFQKTRHTCMNQFKRERFRITCPSFKN